MAGAARAGAGTRSRPICDDGHGAGGGRRRGAGGRRPAVLAPAGRDGGGIRRGDGGGTGSRPAGPLMAANSTAGSPARWWCGRVARHERATAAAGRRARPRLDPGRRAIVAEVDRRCPGPPARGSSGVGVERSSGMRRGVVRDIEETTRAITKAMKDAQRMAGVEVGYGLLRHRRRARGRPELPRDGVGHGRRNPHRRRRPGQRHGQQRLLRSRPRAAARDSRRTTSSTSSRASASRSA